MITPPKLHHALGHDPQRKLAGLTQAQLAERLGQPQSFVSKSERRERRIDVIEFIQIAEALGLEPEQLLERVRAELKQRV